MRLLGLAQQALARTQPAASAGLGCAALDWFAQHAGVPPVVRPFCHGHPVLLVDLAAQRAFCLGASGSVGCRWGWGLRPQSVCVLDLGLPPRIRGERNSAKSNINKTSIPLKWMNDYLGADDVSSIGSNSLNSKTRPTPEMSKSKLSNISPIINSNNSISAVNSILPTSNKLCKIMLETSVTIEILSSSISLLF